MWIKRDFETFLRSLAPEDAHPVKVLKGPRQVGKTSLLEHTGRYQLIQFDDFQTRRRASENPRLFLDQFKGPIVLDEATLVPDLFPELKRRVDEDRQKRRKEQLAAGVDFWITGSNQTLLERSVQESLAGRASYFDLNTLSVHELGKLNLAEIMIKGGWPELHAGSRIAPARYLNDLISTFIEKDIVSAAGIERKAAFVQATGLLAGRVGQLMNASDIAKSVGVETTTVQSWAAKLQENAIVRILRPYSNNLNKRLIKTPKVYFEDVGLASRMQGWTEFRPLYVSPAFGHLLENLVLIELCRFFTNRGQSPEIFFLRSREKVEVDFILRLPNNRWIAVEAKSTPVDFSRPQLDLLKQTNLNFIERWVVSPSETSAFEHCRGVSLPSVHEELGKWA
jgi:predicted AAA+ superfamily ATPase